MFDSLLILLLIAAAWYWWDTAWCNERALESCRDFCASRGLQLLDNTVVRRRIWLRRSDQGWLQICRLYAFEYSQDSEHRLDGYAALMGHTVVDVKTLGEDNRPVR